MSEKKTFTEKERVRVYNTRQHKRQHKFSGNRPDDPVDPLSKTPKIRNQKPGPRRRKNLTVSPLTKNPLFTMEDNNQTSRANAPNSGAGEVSFDGNGMMIDQPPITTTAPTKRIANGNKGNGALPKTSQYQNINKSMHNTQSFPTPLIFNNPDPLGIHSGPQSNRPTNLGNQYELAYRPLTFDSVRHMIGEAQEKSMQTMMVKFEQMLKSQLGDRENPQEETNKTNRKKRGNRKNNGGKRYDNINNNFQPDSRKNAEETNSEINRNRIPANSAEARLDSNYFARNQPNGGREPGIPLRRNNFGYGANNNYEQNENRNNRESWSNSYFDDSRERFSGYFSDHRKKVKLEEWGVKFDGSKIEDFWFKIECCQASSPYSWNQVYDNFQCLLTTRYQNWYWAFRRNNRRGDIHLLRNTMLDNFRTRENDIDIWGSMMKRKQKPGERFDDFWREIEDISWKFKTPKSPKEIIQVLRSNMLPEMSLALTVYETNSLSKFLDKCREADKNFRFQSFPQNRYTKKISEIDLEDDPEPLIEAMKFPYKRTEDKSNSKRENITCANCDSTEHLWRECPVEKRRIFCFKCCHQGVTTPNCPKCHPKLQENSNHSD